MVRWKNVLLQMATFNLSRSRPELMKKVIRRGVLKRLPAGYEVDLHFKPRYNPWEQRLCLVPDSDLFDAISARRGLDRDRRDRDVHGDGHQAARPVTSSRPT